MFLEVLALILVFTILFFSYYHGLVRKQLIFSVSSDKKRRELSRDEKKFHEGFREFNLQMVSLYVIESDVRIWDEHVVRALQDLARKHPLLRMEIEESHRGRCYFNEMDNVRVNYTKSDLHATEDHWMEIFTLEAMNKLDFDNPPLWRVCRLDEVWNPCRHVHTNCFVFTFHHAICDGASRINLVWEFLDFLNQYQDGKCISLKPLPLLPPCETLIQGTLLSETSILQTFMSDLYVRVKALGILPRWLSTQQPRNVQRYFDKYPLTRDIQNMKIDTGAFFHVFDSTRTANVVAACKKNGCSVTSAIVAASSLAMAEVLRESDSFLPFFIPSAVAVNIRKHVSQLTKIDDIHKHCGLFVGVMGGSLMVPAYDKQTVNRVFWEMAREKSVDINEGILKRRHLNGYRLLYACTSEEALRKVLLRDIKTSIDRRYSGSLFFVSNNGRVDTGSNETHFKLINVFAGVAEYLQGCLFTINTMTVNGQLCWSFIYQPHLTPEVQAKDFQDRIFANLEMAVNS